MYTFESRIRYSEVDEKGMLTLKALCDYFQDCSSFQTHEMGIGIAKLKEKNLAFVITSWNMDINRLPNLGEKVYVKTAPYEVKGIFVKRSYLLESDKGEVLAAADSLWVLIDINTGKFATDSADVCLSCPLEKRVDVLEEPRKIKVKGDLKKEIPIIIERDLLDMNGHVNNVSYIDLASNFIPKEMIVCKLVVEYRKQAFLGEVLFPRTLEDGNEKLISFVNKDEEAYVNVKIIGR